MADTADTDRRTWHVSKEIPVALIVSMAVAVFTGGVAYQALQGKLERQGETLVEIRTENKETKTEVRSLSSKMEEGSVPSAQNAWRITQLEATVTDLKLRVAENERRLARTDNAAATTEARMRAQKER